MRAGELYPKPTSNAVTVVMKANRRVDTRPELLLRSALHRAGWRFRKDYPINVGGRVVRPDVVFTRKRVAVFVDGCFWHLCPQHGRMPRGANAEYWKQKLTGNRERDQRDTLSLEEQGWRVVRIWEHIPPSVAAQLVRDALHPEQ